MLFIYLLFYSLAKHLPCPLVNNWGRLRNRRSRLSKCVETKGGPTLGEKIFTHKQGKRKNLLVEI